MHEKCHIPFAQLHHIKYATKAFRWTIVNNVVVFSFLFFFMLFSSCSSLLRRLPNCQSYIVLHAAFYSIWTVPNIFAWYFKCAHTLCIPNFIFRHFSFMNLYFLPFFLLSLSFLLSFFFYSFLNITLRELT